MGFIQSRLDTSIGSSEDQPRPVVVLLFNWLVSSPLLLAYICLGTAISVLLGTRIYSSRLSRSKWAGLQDAKTVPMLPYWVPKAGHLLTLIRDPDRFLRRRSRCGIFALNLGGYTHNIVHSPALIKSVLQQRPGVVEYDSIIWYMCHTVFGALPQDQTAYLEAFYDVHDAVTSCLLKGRHLTDMLSGAVGNMQEQIPNLVSFSSSVIDQAPWERASRAEVGSATAGLEQHVEADLCSLIRHFLGHASAPALLGQAFLEQFPDAVSDAFEFDAGFILLALKLPRWLPIRPLTRAHIARSRLLSAFTVWHRALDRISMGMEVGVEWGEMDDVSEVMRRRNEAWRKHGLSPATRAAGDLGLFWAMNANANMLCFWLILRIFATPGLLERIRTELAPYATVTQPKTSFGIPEPPRLKLDIEGITSSCPYLRASYLECLRVHSAPWSFKYVAKDFVVRDPDAAQGPSSFVLRSGSYVSIPHEMHQLDPEHFKDPDAFDPTRFFIPPPPTTSSKLTPPPPPSSSPEPESEKDGPPTTTPTPPPRVDNGSLRPYGGGPTMCKGRVFAEKECLALVAGVVAMWDLEPVHDGGRWVIPSHVKATAVAAPAADVRVRLKRRVVFA